MNRTYLQQPLLGWDDRYVPAEKSAAEAIDLKQLSEGTWKPRGGTIAIPLWKFAPQDNPVSNISSIGWFSQKRNGRAWVLFECDLVVSTPGGPETTHALCAWAPWENRTDEPELEVIQTGRTRVRPYHRTQYTAIGDWVYITNGADAPIRWNGVEVNQVGFFAPAVPPVCHWSSGVDQVERWDLGYTLPDDNTSLVTVQMRGLGDLSPEDAVKRKPSKTDPWVASWVVAYRIAYVSDLGMESAPSAPSVVRGLNTINGDETADDAWDAYPADGRTGASVHIQEGPDAARGVRVYRTRTLRSELGTVGVSDLGDYFLLEEFPSGQSQSFTDMKDDVFLGRRLADIAALSTPVQPSLIASYRNRLFLVQGDEVFYSRVGAYEQFPSANVLRPGGRDSGPITGLFASREALYLFKRHAVFSLTITAEGFIQLTTVTEQVGCIAPYAVAEVPDLGVLFLSHEGPYMMVGALDSPGRYVRAQFIGQGLRKLWKRMTKPLLQDAIAIVNSDTHEVWFGLSTDGVLGDRMLLAFNYETKAWNVSFDYPTDSLTVMLDQRKYVLCTVGGSQIHVVTEASPTTPTRDIAPLYRSSWIDFNNAWGRTKVILVEPRLLGHGPTRDVTVTVGLDRRDEVRFDSETRRVIDEEWEGERPQWGTDVWSETQVWTSRAPTTVTYSIDVEECAEFQWEVQGVAFTMIGCALRTDVVKPKGHFPRIEQSLGEMT